MFDIGGQRQPLPDGRMSTAAWPQRSSLGTDRAKQRWIRPGLGEMFVCLRVTAGFRHYATQRSTRVNRILTYKKLPQGTQARKHAFPLRH